MKALRYVLAFILLLTLTVPTLAGPPDGKGPGGGGGNGGGEDPPEIPDTGELYGDLYVILRDGGGVPILDGNGCIQPISDITSDPITYCWQEDGNGDYSLVTCEADPGDEDYAFTTAATSGEPFTLADYTLTIGGEDVLEVECELLETMADWVQEVDFGRLNLGRAPEPVIAHAFDEAVTKLNAATTIDIDPSGRLIVTVPDDETEDPDDTYQKTIDSPAENLSLYIKMMIDGDWYTRDRTPITQGGPPDEMGPPEGDGPSEELRPLLSETAAALLGDLGFTNMVISDTDKHLENNELLLAASLLAAAADKFGAINLDKVVYINSIYGINQAGSLGGEVEGKTYFDFGGFGYGRTATFQNRSSGPCTTAEEYGPGWIWVLQPVPDTNYYEPVCMEILSAVQFIDMSEIYSTVDPDYPVYDANVRGFTQAADDALQVLEYIHNYSVPEDLYAE